MEKVKNDILVHDMVIKTHGRAIYPVIDFLLAVEKLTTPFSPMDRGRRNMPCKTGAKSLTTMENRSNHPD